jgi:hypothetical protein
MSMELLSIQSFVNCSVNRLFVSGRRINTWQSAHRILRMLINPATAGSEMSAESRSLEPVCFDCGLSYESSRWADLVVSNEVWAQIAPFEGNGLLCANCMVGRCTRLGIKDPTAKFTSGPFATSSDAGLMSPEGDERPTEHANASLTQEIESLRASLANEKEAREKLEFELAARDVNDPALDEAIDKMQEGFKILQQHKSKRRKTT